MALTELDKIREQQARISGMIDGLTTAYATILNAGRARSLQLLDEQIKTLKEQFNTLQP